MFRSNIQRAFTVALLGFPTVALAEVEYEFFLVESFQPEYQYSSANIFDINENNVALGSATGGSFLWTEAAGKMLLPPSSPRGVNNHGMIAAGVEVLDTNTGEHIDVPAPSASYYLRTLGSINDSGLGVGGSSHGGPSCEPFDCPYGCSNTLVWSEEEGSSHITNVPHLKRLFRVNNDNVAIGVISANCGSEEGVVYDLDDGTWTNLSDLLPPTGTGHTAQTPVTDISDAGHVVGQASSGSTSQAFIWTGAAGFTYLPAIPGADVMRVHPESVNTHGQVVGAVLDEVEGEWKAFVWDAENGIRDLNTLAEPPTNFILNYAERNNDNGWIVGSGHFGPGWATQRGFVLKPIVVQPVAGDANGDGIVNVDDLLAVISSWGACGGACPADIAPAPEGDSVVDVSDLVMVITNWG